MKKKYTKPTMRVITTRPTNFMVGSGDNPYWKDEQPKPEDWWHKNPEGELDHDWWHKH